MQLMQRAGDGEPLRVHLLKLAEAGQHVDERLTQKPPHGGEVLWGTFCELAALRPAGMGPTAIPVTEIEAWQRLHGLRLTGWELDTLMAMDRKALEVMQDEEKKRRQQRRKA